MIRKILLIFMMMVVFASDDMATASEIQPNYLTVIDEAIDSGIVLYTIYPKMSLEELRENFKGATQWTLVDDGEIRNIPPNTHYHTYYIYRNIGDNDPVYEVLEIHTDKNNDYVESYWVRFFTKSEMIAKAMYDKMVNEAKKKYGNPEKNTWMHKPSCGNGKGDFFEYDLLESYVWYKRTYKSFSISLFYMKDKAAEFISKSSHLPEVMNYRVDGLSMLILTEYVID